MKKLFLLAASATLLFSCGGNSNSTAPAADSLQGVQSNSAEAVAEYYGSKITEDSAVAISDLTTLMGTNTELACKVTGEIDAVCQKKGCWMDIKNPSGESVRITFKDYGFFMPKDAAGRTAIMEGIAKVEETSVADLQEYAKDAGKTKDEIAAITTPKKELVFEASGVILR